MPVNLDSISTFDELVGQVRDDWWQEILRAWRAGKLSPFLGAKPSETSPDGIYLHYADEPYALVARDVILVLADADEETTCWRQSWARRYSERVIVVTPRWLAADPAGEGDA